MTQNGITEADITINGVQLTFAQSMTLRVAIGGFLMDLQGSLAEDKHGRAMVGLYRSHIHDVANLMNLNQP